MSIILAGSEAGAFEKLDAAVAKAAEGAEKAHLVEVTDGMRRAVEAATELGLMLSDGRWASIATRLDKARVFFTGLNYADRKAGAARLAEQLRVMRGQIRALRHGRLH